MYFIYKITNLVNQKVYIGSSSISRGYNKRWKEHIRDAWNEDDSKYNYHLYAAMRKYGLKNFSYEVIENHIKTPEERAQKEKEYILKYDSINPE